MVEDLIRPAAWSRNEHKVPNQYPCFGFFGFSSEISQPDKLSPWAVKNCTASLFRIGKGQLPAGLIATCRSPKTSKHQAGGNDQLQRMRRLSGIAKGKDEATATNSACANVAFVAATHQVSPSMMTFSTSSDAPSKPPQGNLRVNIIIATPRITAILIDIPPVAALVSGVDLRLRDPL